VENKLKTFFSYRHPKDTCRKVHYRCVVFVVYALRVDIALKTGGLLS